MIIKKRHFCSFSSVRRWKKIFRYFLNLPRRQGGGSDPLTTLPPRRWGVRTPPNQPQASKPKNFPSIPDSAARASQQGRCMQCLAYVHCSMWIAHVDMTCTGRGSEERCSRFPTLTSHFQPPELEVAFYRTHAPTESTNRALCPDLTHVDAPLFNCTPSIGIG